MSRIVPAESDREAGASWEIRRGRPLDAVALAALAELTFRDTFGPFNTSANMDAYCSRAFAPARVAAELQEPRSTVFLVEESGALIGYARLHAGEAPDCVAGAAANELQRLYVRQDWHGRGVARR